MKPKKTYSISGSYLGFSFSLTSRRNSRARLHGSLRTLGSDDVEVVTCGGNFTNRIKLITILARSKYIKNNQFTCYSPINNSYLA